MSTDAKASAVMQTPICSSCSHTIPPGTRAARLNCPNCGEITIWRCQKCRQFGRHYRCPKCGFVGP